MGQCPAGGAGGRADLQRLPGEKPGGKERGRFHWKEAGERTKIISRHKQPGSGGWYSPVGQPLRICYRRRNYRRRHENEVFNW